MVGERGLKLSGGEKQRHQYHGSFSECWHLKINQHATLRGAIFVYIILKMAIFAMVLQIGDP